jgi:hypothetical protein
LTIPKDNGFCSNTTSFKYTGSSRDDMLPVASTSDESRYMHERVYNSAKSASSVAALKELVSSCFNYELLISFALLTLLYLLMCCSVQLRGIT